MITMNKTAVKLNLLFALKNPVIIHSVFALISLTVGITYSAISCSKVHLESEIIMRSTGMPIALMCLCYFVTIPVLLICSLVFFLSIKFKKVFWASYISSIVLSMYWLFWTMVSVNIPLD